LSGPAAPCGALRATSGSPDPARALSSDRVDDVVSIALDEASVVFEQFVDRLPRV